MKDIKGKDLFNLWKEVLVDTLIGIWQVIYKVSKSIWKGIVWFYNVTPWVKIHPYIFLGIVAIILSQWNIDRINANEAISEYQQENSILERCIDSIQTDCEYNYLQVKAGEYAMKPHKQKAAITKDSIASLLVELDAWYPDIIMSQIEIESSFGKSALAKNNNNIIGMRKTTSRRTTQIKGSSVNGYGVYNNWESCVIDRILWDHAKFGSHKPTRAQYVNALNKTYASASGYGTTVNANSKKYRDLF